MYKLPAKRIVGFVFICIFLFSGSSYGQTFHESKKHRKMWGWWRSHKTPYNPYVKNDKSTHLESRKAMKENSEMMKSSRKQRRKEVRQSEKKLGIPRKKRSRRSRKVKMEGASGT